MGYAPREDGMRKWEGVERHLFAGCLVLKSSTKKFRSFSTEPSCQAFGTVTSRVLLPRECMFTRNMSPIVNRIGEKARGKTSG